MSNPKDSTEVKKSNLTRIREECEKLELVKCKHTSKVYAVIDSTEPHNVAPLDSSEIKDRIYLEVNKDPSKSIARKSDISEVLSLKQAQNKSYSTVEISNRYYHKDKVTYINLGPSVLSVSKDEIKNTDKEIFFKKPMSYRSIPKPNLNVDFKKQLLKLLYFFNFKSNESQIKEVLSGNMNVECDKSVEYIKDFIIFLTYAMSLLLPTQRKTIYKLVGLQGSAKSAYATFLKWMFDPHDTNTGFSPNKSVQDNIPYMVNNYLATFDNVSYISKTLSDFFCQAINRTMSEKRKLYSDDDSARSFIDCAIMFNSIGLITNQDDFLERVTMYQVPPLRTELYKDFSTLEAEFEKEIPNFYGAFLLLFKEILKNYYDPKFKPKSISRLQSFDKIGYSLIKALGYDETFFEKIKDLNNRDLKAIKEDENDFLYGLNVYFNNKLWVSKTNSHELKGLSSEVFHAIKTELNDSEIPFPCKNVKQFGKRLRREHKTLLELGYTIKRLPRSSRGTGYLIKPPIDMKAESIITFE